MYVPEYAGPVEGYAHNYVHRNLWRVSRTHTREDALQEAWLVFARCQGKYPQIDTPQHFMALYKTALYRHFVDLALSASHYKAEVPEAQFDREDEQEWSRQPVGDLDNDGQLRVLIRQAPREVKMVLSLFLNAPQELLDVALQAWETRGRRRAEGNRVIGRLLGLHQGANVLDQLEEHFTPRR